MIRLLADFAKLVELFDQHSVSFVSVTQSFNTTSSMGRLTLNVLLSFAQFEREVIGERVRDKIAASKRKGLWVGGQIPLAYAKRQQEARGGAAGGRDGAVDIPAGVERKRSSGKEIPCVDRKSLSSEIAFPKLKASSPLKRS